MRPDRVVDYPLGLRSQGPEFKSPSGRSFLRNASFPQRPLHQSRPDLPYARSTRVGLRQDVSADATRRATLLSPTSFSAVPPTRTTSQQQQSTLLPNRLTRYAHQANHRSQGSRRPRATPSRHGRRDNARRPVVPAASDLNWGTHQPGVCLPGETTRNRQTAPPRGSDDNA